MNELLFKLKKEGKTVGYLKIRGGNLLGSEDGKRFTFVTEQNQSRGIYLYRDIGRPFIDYDSAHPFVCKDKNGKGVFAGDKVKANGIIAIVKLDVRECRYMLSTIPSLCEYPPGLYDHMGSKFIWSDIELIEEKEDE